MTENKQRKMTEIDKQVMTIAGNIFAVALPHWSKEGIGGKFGINDQHLLIEDCVDSARKIVREILFRVNDV